MPHSNKLNITDFVLASCLLTLGFNDYDLDTSNPKKVVIMFEMKPKLEETVSAYWRKELRLEPQLLQANVKTLRARIFG